MARYIGPVFRLYRREGTDLDITDKWLRKAREGSRTQRIPGQHGAGKMKKPTGYSLQLREKQKVKRIYGVLEKQFHRYFERAESKKGVTGHNLLQFLEQRLDNVVYRLGFSTSRRTARQMVAHGHILVNGKKVDIPSFQVKPGSTIELKAKMKENDQVKSALERGKLLPKWLSLDSAACKGQVISLPMREDITLDINEQLIVELYSK
jgi:small subunit ribosomal protein S4